MAVLQKPNKIIKELGLKTGLQRADTVMIGANIKKMNRLMLFHKVLSNFIRRLNKLDYKIDKEIVELVKEDSELNDTKEYKDANRLLTDQCSIFDQFSKEYLEIFLLFECFFEI